MVFTITLSCMSGMHAGMQLHRDVMAPVEPSQGRNVPRTTLGVTTLCVAHLMPVHLSGNAPIQSDQGDWA